MAGHLAWLAVLFFFFFWLKPGLNQSKGYGCICLDLSLDLLSIFKISGYFFFFFFFFLKSNFQNDRKISQPIKIERFIACNLGLMHQKDHK